MGKREDAAEIVQLVERYGCLDYLFEQTSGETPSSLGTFSVHTWADASMNRVLSQQDINSVAHEAVRRRVIHEWTVARARLMELGVMSVEGEWL